MLFFVQAKRWFFRNFTRAQEVNRCGLRWYLDPADKLQNLLLAGIVHEFDKINKSCTFIEKLKIDSAFDIGANFGLYSNFWASRSSINSIYAFEPVKKTYVSLSKNIVLNDFSPRIQTFNIALGAKEGEEQIQYNPRKSGGASLMQRSNQSLFVSEKITMRRLDSIIKLSDKTLFIKIDVEGYAYNVLKGGHSLLLKNNCIIQVEAFADQRKAIADSFDQLGYRCLGVEDNDFYYANFEHPALAIFIT